MTLSKHADGPQAAWFQHLSQSKSPVLRVFCFPYAGASAEVYRNWQRLFPFHIDLCLVHLPGRGRRLKERPFTRIAPLVQVIAEHIQHETNIPYALYGHSMGALISFELARELFRSHNRGPEHLFVSGRHAPQWPRDEPITFNLPHDEFISELQRLEGTPAEVLNNPELLEVFEGLLRADFEAVETYEYRPGKPLPCPITVYGGLQDKHVPGESCRAWQEQTLASCKVRMFPGGHFFIRDQQPDFVNVFRNDVLSIARVPHSQL